MTRPSFQFYPADWRNNAKLSRCSWAARGAWLSVMCLLHDSDEYGILDWPLKEIAQAIGCPMSCLKELTEKGVLKGLDKGESTPLEYTPRSGRQAGPTVVLIEARQGPIWFSSRMVRDEYIRQKKGNQDLYKDSPNKSPKNSPMPPMGELFGDAPMPPKSDLPSSSSSSSSKNLGANTLSDTSTDIGPDGTTAGALCIALRRKGVMAQPHDPRITALAEQGMTPEVAAAAAEEGRLSYPDQRIGLGLVVTILDRWRKEAKKINVAGASPPSRSTSSRDQSRAAAAASIGLGAPDHDHHDTTIIDASTGRVED